jgi:DNA-3-methyladenine glycosylase II
MIDTVSPTRTATPLGPFSLANQDRYFGGWITTGADDRTVVMGFPVEGWTGSAAVALREHGDGGVTGTVTGAGDPDVAWRQALAVLSLDVDGAGFPDVGRVDGVIGALQAEHAHLRPVLFHSPYEAACAFIVAHRLSIVAGRAIRRRMAERYGDAMVVEGVTVHAFPAPEALLRIDAFPSLTPEKVERLHGVARAALGGALDRERLRRMPVAEAVADVRRLRGVGEFFASAIVLRGAGVVDANPGDDITRAGVRRLYDLAGPPSTDEFAAIAEAWRPYRMWCSVLVHVAERRHREAIGR